MSASQAGQAYEKPLRSLALRILAIETWDQNLDVIIADDEQLRRLHRSFYADDSITDVMAFPENGHAEIYLNLDEARRQAVENKETLLRALSRLMIHGILHLWGWRDDNGAQRREMLQYGELLLSKHGNAAG